jgi:hypothetical protein
MLRFHRPTHSQRLENWLGPEIVQTISQSQKLWYGDPIAIAGVPGAVYAAGGGDFVGPIQGGGFANLADFVDQRLRRIARNTLRRMDGKTFTGFASLSDLISEATAGGKRQDSFVTKSGSLAVSAAWASLWNVGVFPAAGTAPSNIPGGSVPTNATTGSLKQTDPGGSDTLHLTTMQFQASTAPNTLLLYDRTFHAAAVQHNTTSNQAVSGVPTRYATTTSPGVFAFPEITTVLGATAHNYTMTYTDQSGNTAEAAAAAAIIVSSAVTRIPLAQYFVPLNAGDTGLRTITNIACSAASTGVSNVVMGKPLVLVPQPVANSMVVMDGINSAFSLVQVLAGACLAWIELKGVGSASTYTGSVTMVSG